MRKKRSLVRLLKRLSPAVLLVEDETDLLLFPPLRAGWAREGEPVRVLLGGSNARRVVFGAMDLRTGERILLERDRQRSVDFQQMLLKLRDRWPAQSMVVLLDEDPSHTAKASQALAERLNTRLLWLPKRTPELNPMDTLWGHAKHVVSANRQYATIDEHAHAFVEFLSVLSNEEALILAGATSPDFWLRSVLSKHFLWHA